MHRWQTWLLLAQRASPSTTTTTATVLFTIDSMVLMCRRLLRRPILICLLVANILLIVYFIFNYNSDEYAFFEENYIRIGDGRWSAEAVGGSKELHACQLPIDVSPFDASIQSYLVSHPKQVQCLAAEKFRPLTYVNQNEGVLLQNSTAYECHYQLLHKHSSDDDKVVYSAKQRLDPQHGLKLDEEENYIEVQCCCVDGQSYQNLHFWFQPKVAKKKLTQRANHSTSVGENDGKQKLPTTTHTNQTVLPSVLILVVESLSRLNYFRYLNQTKQVLEHEYGDTFYLEGLNKQADNSFPNMVPLLTGKRMYFGELTNENYGPYDDWPLIWKLFAARGYTTALVEDYPRFTLFNYFSNGFVKGKPTNFYPRPYWLHLFKDVNPMMLRLFPFNIDPCYRERVPKVDLFFEQIHQFVRNSHRASLPFFAFTFYIELTHNDFNKAQTIDSHIAKFLRDSADILNDTIMVLMGDHGNRFGSVLQTTIGRIEERMPLFAMHLPKQLFVQYPHLRHYLQLNRRRLVTWLDVHQMLLDVVNGDFGTKPRSRSSSSSPTTTVDDNGKPIHAYSPWREEISQRRTCQEALIPELYCACDRRIELDQKRNKLATTASAALITHLNAQLKSSGKCHLLSLNETLKAELIFPSDSTAQAHGFKQTIEVTIVASPSNAIFRSRLYRSARNLKWTVYGNQVTRINEYGDQSWCIEQRDLKPFCLCQQRDLVSM